MEHLKRISRNFSGSGLSVAAVAYQLLSVFYFPNEYTKSEGYVLTLSAICGFAIALIALGYVVYNGSPGLGHSLCSFPLILLKAVGEGPNALINAFDVGLFWTCGASGSRQYCLVKPALFCYKVLIKLSLVYVFCRAIPFLVVDIMVALRNPSISIVSLCVSSFIVADLLLKLGRDYELLSMYGQRDQVNDTNPIDQSVVEDDGYSDAEIQLLDTYGRTVADAVYGNGNVNRQQAAAPVNVCLYYYLVNYLSTALFKTHDDAQAFSVCYRVLFINEIACGNTLRSAFEFCPEMVAGSNFSEQYRQVIQDQLVVTHRCLPANTFGTLFSNVINLHCDYMLKGKRSFAHLNADYWDKLVIHESLLPRNVSFKVKLDSMFKANYCEETGQYFYHQMILELSRLTLATRAHRTVNFDLNAKSSLTTDIRFDLIYDADLKPEYSEYDSTLYKYTPGDGKREVPGTEVNKDKWVEYQNSTSQDCKLLRDIMSNVLATHKQMNPMQSTFVITMDS